MSDAPPTVWGAGTARTLRVYWALHEFAVPFERRVVRTRTADMDNPAFLAVSPGRKIPAFTHGDLALTESGAIAAYVFERFGDAAGRDTALRAEVNRWSFFVLTELDATALYVLRRHVGLPDIYGEAPAAVDAAAGYFARQAEVLAERLADGRETLVPGLFTEADIHLVTCCEWAGHCGLALPSALARYRDRLVTRPAYAAALASNDPAR